MKTFCKALPESELNQKQNCLLVKRPGHSITIIAISILVYILKCSQTWTCMVICFINLLERRRQVGKALAADLAISGSKLAADGNLSNH